MHWNSQSWTLTADIRNCINQILKFNIHSRPMGQIFKSFWAITRLMLAVNAYLIRWILHFFSKKFARSFFNSKKPVLILVEIHFQEIFFKVTVLSFRISFATAISFGWFVSKLKRWMKSKEKRRKKKKKRKKRKKLKKVKPKKKWKKWN